MLREWWEKLSRVEAGSSAGMFVFVVMAMGGVTVVAAIMALISASLFPFVIAGVGWGSFLLFALLRATVLERGSRIVASTGSTTPSVAQHSNIEAMEARGDLAGAAAAYRAVIEADPQDLVACEKLGRLAMSRLNDYDTAIWAYREAERRSTEPRRRMGFSLLVVGLYRDNLRDAGRTIVEIRKFLARWPDAPNAAELQADLERLKAEHFRDE